jgi:hypothetical protein
MTRVDILNFDGCPNNDATADRIRTVAAGLGIEIDLRFVRVESAEEAVRERFLGSPSVRVNGVDIDPSARDRSDFGLSCRVYAGSGVPPDAMITAALARKASDGSGRGSGFASVGAVIAGALSSAYYWRPLVLIATVFSLAGIPLAFASLAQVPGAADAPSTSLRVLKDDLRPLLTHFNATADRYRFLAILSPT